MFTGIIEATGDVIDLHRHTSGGARLRLRLPAFDEPLALGESLAVNGCCLTVTETTAEGEVCFDLLEQTLTVTNLGDLQSGRRVNLERSLQPMSRLSGHFVQGHVDTTTTVLRRASRGQDTRFDLALPEAALGLVIPKGSIALDGISLTIAELEEAQLSVWIIPHTLKVTNLGERQEGERVNVEFDMLGKYVQRLGLTTR